MTDHAGLYSEYVPTLTERVLRWLGFHGAYQSRPEPLGEFPSYMVTEIRVHATFGDRMRFLITGRMDLETVHQTDKDVERIRSQTAIGFPAR